jgi:hypothetical protein
MMIDSLKTVLNLQVLTIEKTLVGLNKLLDTKCTNEITATTTAISKLVNDLVAKMVKVNIYSEYPNLNKFNIFVYSSKNWRWTLKMQ